MEATKPQQSFLYAVVLPKVEVISWALAVLGFAAKWNQFNAANTMLFIGFANLAVVSFLRAFQPTMDDLMATAPAAQPTSFLGNVVLSKVAGLGGAVVLIGTLFKLLPTAGGQMLLLVGNVTLLLVVVLLALQQRLNRRALLLAALGGLVFYTPSEVFVRQFYRNDPVLVEKMLYQLHHPRDRAAAEAVRAYQRQHPRS